MRPEALRRVLLVGFMGAGKSSVGTLLAARLGWRFLDFDTEIEVEAGLPVARIFEQRGEAAFRALERAVGSRLLGEHRVVLGTGGGWPANVGGLDELPEGTASVWLQVSPTVALGRVAGQPGARPLLAVDDPASEAGRLLEERAALYATAGWAVDTDGSSVEDVTARILKILATEYSDVGLNER